jgi:hypothetical protein
MSKNLLKTLLVFPALLGAFIAVAAPSVAAEKAALSEEATVPSSTLGLAEQNITQAMPAAPIAQALPAAPIAQAMPAANSASPSDSASLEQINRYVREGRSNQLGQVTSVSQLTDVKPTDWAFQALQSLVERYGCIVGYPDRTFRGNRATTRFEFAAGLNACLDKIQELIAAATADFVKKEDLEVVKRLQEEFATELAALRGRVESLEVRTATLEKQQFSTTTKLSGEVIFAVTDEFAQPGNNETVFQDRVRLLLSSSFTGRDKLVVRLDAGNANAFREFDLAGNNLTGLLGGASLGLQTFNFGNTGGNRVNLGWVAYYFPVGENIQVYVPVSGGLQYDLLPTHNGPMEDFDGGNGALSLFAQRNPIYDIGGGAGAAIGFGVGKPISLYVSYLSDTANDPSQGRGLFNGGYSAIAQISFTPNEKFSIGLTGVNAFRKGSIFDFGSGAGSAPLVGTVFGSNPLGVLSGAGVNVRGSQGAVVNGVGASAVFKLTNNIVINGFGSVFQVDVLRDGLGDGDVWTYGGGVSFMDFGKKGNLLGLFAGVPPYLGGLRFQGNREVPIHVEGFYRVRLTDNISLTPGVIWVINPTQGFTSSDTLIGTLRTTFTF